MEVIIDRACRMDVHKDSITAFIITPFLIELKGKVSLIRSIEARINTSSKLEDR
ncbi:hypothetical protein [Psychrobacillus sp. FSL K6-2843]|uniref:hypothetical protein n=1 Tax=Psychrobacillus sp. FSL K6-2843 TaxID=2921549 RepID=UPI003159DCB7